MNRRKLLQGIPMALWGGAALLLPGRSGHATVGAKPSDFTLKGAAGAPWKGTFRMGDHIGKKPVVITFCASWCNPCELEMVELQKHYTRLGSKGLMVVAIAIDDAQTAPLVGPMARRLKVEYPVVVDIDSSVTGRYNPRRVCPFMIQIDRKGRIVHESEGWTPEHQRELPRELDTLVAE